MSSTRYQYSKNGGLQRHENAGSSEGALHGFKRKIVGVAAAKTLAAGDSGSLVAVTPPGSSTYAIDLPTASAAGEGWWCEFVFVATGAGTVTIENANNEIYMIGLGADFTAGVSQASPLDIITYAASGEIGDRLRLVVADGKYFAESICHDAAHFSIA